MTKKVGIYSFSALFAEGFLQALIVLQNIFNPKTQNYFLLIILWDFQI